VAVEKLPPEKFAEIKSRQDALQTIFSGRLDIFYPPILGILKGKRVFQQPQAITLIDPVVSVIAILRQLRGFGII
jgi:hypothetical protein